MYLSLGLLGLVATLLLNPVQTRALSQSDQAAVYTIQAGESKWAPWQENGQVNGQQQNTVRKGIGIINRMRFAGRSVKGGECRNNGDCTRDPSNCVRALDGSGRQNGTGRQNGAGTNRVDVDRDCTNPDGARTPRRDGSGNPRR